MSGWEELDVRARGLSGHLLGRRRLEALARAEDLRSFAAGIAPEYRPVQDGGSLLPVHLDVGLRRGAAARLGTLFRWCGTASRRLAPFLLDEDRRAFRALIRGSLAGLAPESRLVGLVPTPALPERALEELARQPTPASIATLLVVWGHPMGRPILDEAAKPHPDLLHLDLALQRAYAEEAARAARGCGAAMVEFAAERIDLENGCAALMLAGAGQEFEPAAWFLPGGRRLDGAAFAAAATAADRGEAARRIGHAFAGSPYAVAYRSAGSDPASLERVLLGQAIDQQIDRSYRDPLGPWPMLAYLLRLRAEAMDLGRILWGRLMGAVAGDLITGLVTAS